MKRAIIYLTSLFCVLGLYAVDGDAACSRSTRVTSSWGQTICPGTENERTTSKSASHYVSYGVPGCDSDGTPGTPVISGGGTSTSSGGGGGGGQGSGGVLPPGGTASLIAPDECVVPQQTDALNEDQTRECVGSSVIMANGTYEFTEVDLQVAAKGIPIVWKRTYRSNIVFNDKFFPTKDSSLGFGWGTPFTQHLEVGSNYARQFDEEGRQTHFTAAVVEQATRSSGSAASGASKKSDYDVATYSMNTFFFRTDPRLGKSLRHIGGEIFALSERGGFTYTYMGGRLLSIEDQLGNKVELHYEDNPFPADAASSGEGAKWYSHPVRLSSVEDTTGRPVLVFNYNDVGYISSVTDFSGRSVQYAYDDFGNLTEVTKPDGSITTYTYNSFHGMTSKTNALGEIYQMEYEKPEKGILKKVIDPVGSTLLAEGKQPDGHVKSFAYDFDNSVFYTTDYDGTTRKKTINGKGYLTSEVLLAEDGEKVLKKIEYLEDNSEEVTDAAGNVTTIKRDEWRNILSMTDGEGNRTTTVYNMVGKPLTVTDPSGIVTRFEYNDADDPYYSLSRINYVGNQGVLLLKKIEAEGLPDERITLYGYSRYGELESVTVGEATTTITYDDNGLPVTITDPLGHANRLEYDYAGHITAAIDALGNRTVFTYDDLGNLLTVKDPLGNVTTMDYNAAGQLKKITDALDRETQIETDFRERITAIVDALNYRKDYAYDGKGRLLSVTEGGSLSTFNYDDSGRLISTTDAENNTTTYEYADAGCTSCGANSAIPENIIDPFGNVTKNLFDKTGRVIGMKNPLGQLTSLAYDAKGQVARQTDGNGKITRFEYDALGRLTSQTDAEGGVTSFSYDQRDNLLTLTDPELNVTTFEYDLAGRKTKEIRPMGQTTSYSYYANGLLKTVTDAKGQVTTYSYDAASRLTAVTYADDSQDTFAYDAVGNMTGWTGADGVSGSMAYDKLNRKTGETVDYGGFSKSIAYSYDAYGNKTGYTSPEGIEHVYAYDKNGRPTSLAFDGKTVDLTYDKTRLAQVAFPNGVTTDYSYNANSWLSGITSSGPQGTVLSRDYGFDAVGNILSKNSEHGNYSYGYDATYQLTSADNPQLSDENYTYDKVGNRLTSSDVSGPISHNANNELIGHSAAVYEYDANGNTVKKTVGDQVTSYVYNARNRLEKVYLPDGRVASYAYDPFGRRVKKQVGNSVTYFAYADEGLVGEYDATGSMEKVYGWYPNGLWGTNPLYMVDGGDYFYYHADHLGTPQRLTAGDGNIAWSAGYAAFGKAQVDPLLSSVSNNLRFPGQYFDDETGLHYNWQRYYDPESGRYTQVDPIGFAGGDVNFYRYASNSVLLLFDPLGLESTPILDAGGTMGLFGGGSINFFGIKITAKANFGRSETMVNSNNKVSQNFEMSATIKDIGIGFQFSRSKEGETKSPQIDIYGRVHPGIGVQDILDGEKWDKRFPVLSWKDASYDGDIKLGFDLGFLLGLKAEINFSELYRDWKEAYDGMNRAGEDGSIPTNKFGYDPFKNSKMKSVQCH